MVFLDKVKIYVEAGSGGNGCLSFRREKFVPWGGPNGGDGGDGGDVYLEASRHVNTLFELSMNPHLRGEKGEHGRGSDQTGASGDDFTAMVPPGTIVYERGPERLLLGELLKDGERLLVAKGGRGGRGNAAFKSSTNRAPKIAEQGTPGEKKVLELELKLLADVGIVGLPNAGKSSLLARLTRAHPKIADYPFTTTSPILGVCSWKGKSFVLADIPGLIAGASRGRGLGDEFLRHVERTRVLIHLIDPQGYEGLSPSAGIKVIEKELKLWSPELHEKPRLLALNKMDLGAVGQSVLKKIKRNRRQASLFPISAVTGAGINKLLNELLKYARHKV